MGNGSLYLVPNYLGNLSYYEFNKSVKKVINDIQYFVFENEKPGRAFIKAIIPEKNQAELIISTLNKFTKKLSKGSVEESLYISILIYFTSSFSEKFKVPETTSKS